jgi:hypothetical protein
MLMQQVGLDVFVQIAGKMLSFQSDVFALGTVMWEFLSETVPFSDVHDPLKQDLPTMAIALNTRHIFMRSDMLARIKTYSRTCIDACVH